MATLYISVDDGANWATFATAGIVSATLTLRATGDDQIAWSVDPATWASAAGYAAGAKVCFKQDNTVFFVGRLGPIPRNATGQNHNLSYIAYGPWARLEKITYGQQWTLRAADNTEVSLTKPRVVLGQVPSTSAHRSTGAEIAAVIDFAIAKGIPILKGTIDTGPTMPFDEQIMLRAADAIRACLRWTPDYVCWWDYSTTDAGVYKPTFHCRAASNLSAATVNLTSTTKPETAQITPLADLVIPGIKITYEKSHTYDSQSWNGYEIDTAGTYADPEAVELLFELKGSTATILKQDVEVGTYPADLNDKAFWREHIPWLADIADGDLVITNAARDGEEAYGYYLKQGCIQPWMSVQHEEELFEADCAYVRKDGANVVEDVESRKISVRLMSTTATTRTYQVMSSYDSGESTPTGVAAAIYASWSRLHYQGALSIVQASPDFAYIPGKTLRVSNGLAAWATMDAIIQDTTINFESGTTSFNFGPPARLEADSLVALYRATRNRSFSWSQSFRSTSALPGSDATGPKYLPTKSATDGDPGIKRRLAIRDTVSSTLQTLDLNPSTVTFADGADKTALTMQLREVLVPEMSGSDIVFKRRQMMASASYHAPVSLPAGVPNGAAIGDILRWDDTTSAWVNSPVGTPAEGNLLRWDNTGKKWIKIAADTIPVISGISSGDIVKWDGSKFIKLTPTTQTVVTDVQYDNINHVVQKKTISCTIIEKGSESSWTTITGGQAVVEG
jgi:hypothetical protein